MGSNPINLAIRFILELAALFAIGFWGWNQGLTWFRFLLAFGLPIIFAALWGIFNVPDDPSRSGAAPVVVSGIIRLTLEIVFFGIAVWALYDLGYFTLSWILGLIVVVHYGISYDRIIWLLKQ